MLSILHREGVTNPSKDKGDRGERDAVAVLRLLAPDLLCVDAMRMLGAGRKDDVGDLRVFDDVAVQVRAYGMAKLHAALRTSAVDSGAQAANGRMPLAMGLVPYPNARAPRVRWIATATVWPDPAVEVRPFGMRVAKAVTWVRDEAGPVRELRVAMVSGRDAPSYLLAPLEAWLAAYRTTRTSPMACAAA
jgi:hypothetical protein